MYEMAFKVVGTLPDEQAQAARYSRVPPSRERRQSSTSSPIYSHADPEHAQYGYDAVPAAEGESLLRNGDLESGLQTDRAQHVIGADVDSDAEADGDVAERISPSQLPSVLATPKAERAASWNNGEADGDVGDYQTIRAPEAGTTGSARASVEDPSANRRSMAAGKRVSIGGVLPSHQPALSRSKTDASARERKRQSNLEGGESSESENDNAGGSGDVSGAESSEIDEGDEDLIRTGAHRLHRTRSNSSVRTLRTGSGSKGAATGNQTRNGSRPNSGYSASGRGESDDEGDNEDEEADDFGGASSMSRGARASAEGGETSGARAHARATQEWIPPPLPFGMHANVMTSGIGLVTVCVLWMGIVSRRFPGSSGLV